MLSVCYATELHSQSLYYSILWNLNVNTSTKHFRLQAQCLWNR